MLEKKKVTQKEITQLMPIIQEIWPEAFIPIIGQEQVEYMLATYQSRKQIEKEVAEGVQYYLLQKDGKNVGYTAYELTDTGIYLSKLYLLESMRGQGLTSSVFRWYEEVARQENAQEIVLRVNQGNLQAIEVYKHQGYFIVEELISDIGQGFQMVDYKMKKELA